MKFLPLIWILLVGILVLSFEVWSLAHENQRLFEQTQNLATQVDSYDLSCLTQ